MEKTKIKPLSSPESVKAVRWKREGFKETVYFEFRVEKEYRVMESDSGDDEFRQLR